MDAWKGNAMSNVLDAAGDVGGALPGRLLGLHSVPRPAIVLTVLSAYAALVVGGLQRWPLWTIVLATLVPWMPVVAREAAWLYRHYHWLALFYLLTLTQTGHFLEHVAQVAQIHALGIAPRQAHGVFGALDIEWVHFAWNTWVAAAALALLRPFRQNRWLWLVLAIAVWHGIEHTYILSRYLATGTAGTPGFLASGGLIGGGLPLARPDLHFLYNLVETVPLVAAFLWQCRRAYAVGGR
jgi:hypothetical protein